MSAGHARTEPRLSEFALIERIRQRCAHHDPRVRIGIGDDAAVITPQAGEELAICTDTLVAGRHFPHNTRAEDIGWKALAVNLSDLAAIGASPRHAVLALTLPSADPVWVDGFAHGFAELAASYGLSLIGGDTSRGELCITVTAIGSLPAGRALQRRGARVGDRVIVCGELGLAAAGLGQLGLEPELGRSLPLLPMTPAHRWVQKLDRPQPQIAAGLILRERATAGMDISDGLLADLGHLLDASGVGAEIALAAIPGFAELRAALGNDIALRYVLGGGDDYVLLATVAAADWPELQTRLRDQAATSATVIGQVVAQPGIRVAAADGKPIAPIRGGWDHFA